MKIERILLCSDIKKVGQTNPGKIIIHRFSFITVVAVDYEGNNMHGRQNNKDGC